MVGDVSASGLAALAFAVSLGAMPLVLRWLHHRQVLDTPNARSSHVRPTPRGGGLAVAAALLVGALVADLEPRRQIALVLAAAAFGAVGLVDDLRSLSAATRLVMQVVLSAGLVALLTNGLGGPLLWRLVFICGAILWVIAYVNGFNFMDGINGISAAQTIVAGAVWWAIGTSEGVESLALVGAIGAGAAAGFVPFNFPTARVFLGDVGSYAIGAWLAAGAVVGLRGGLPFEAVFAPLALYLADTATTIMRRVRAGEVWHEAHRSHAYQRLTQAGWSHAQVTGVVALVMVLASACGAVALTDSVVARAAADVALVALIAAYTALPSMLSRRGVRLAS